MKKLVGLSVIVSFGVLSLSGCSKGVKFTSEELTTIKDGEHKVTSNIDEAIFDSFASSLLTNTGSNSSIEQLFGTQGLWGSGVSLHTIYLQTLEGYYLEYYNRMKFSDTKAVFTEKNSYLEHRFEISKDDDGFVYKYLQKVSVSDKTVFEGEFADIMDNEGPDGWWLKINQTAVMSANSITVEYEIASWEATSYSYNEDKGEYKDVTWKETDISVKVSLNYSPDDAESSYNLYYKNLEDGQELNVKGKF